MFITGKFEPDLTRPYDRMKMVSTSNNVRVNKQELYGAADMKSNQVMLEEIERYAEAHGNGNPITLVGVSSGTVYEYAPSVLQSNISIDGYKISGNFKQVENGSLPDYWDGYTHFLAIDFTTIPAGTTSLKAGLINMAEVIEDPEKRAVFAIKANTQTLKVESIVGGKTYTQEFNLSGLVLE